MGRAPARPAAHKAPKRTFDEDAYSADWHDEWKAAVGFMVHRYRHMSPSSSGPIEGSEHWWSCWHSSMHKCGEQCCCSEGHVYDDITEMCLNLAEMPEDVKDAISESNAS